MKHPGFSLRLKENSKLAVTELKKSDVPMMYWITLAWAAALAASHDFMMSPEIPRFEALADRVLELDDAYEEGAIHGFLITYEMARLNPKPDRFAIAKARFERARELSQGHQAGPFVVTRRA